MDLGGLYKKIVKKNIPLFMTMEVTTSCNQKCLHCYNVRDGAEEISLEQIQRCLEEATELGALFLGITGGEPLMREDIWDILESAVKLNYATLLYTNGTLIGAPEARRLKKIGIYWVDITILGATAETHDKITGLSGSYDLSMQAIQLLKKEGIPIAVKTPVLRENFSELGELKKQISSIGLMHIISPVIYPKDNGNLEPLKHRLTDEQLRDYFKYFEPVKRINPWGELSCDLGKVMFAINAKGDFYPCLCVPFSIGNISSSSLRSLWRNSPDLKSIRKHSSENFESCVKCNDKFWCFRCEGLAWLEKRKMFVPDSESCRMAKMRKAMDKKAKQEKVLE